ncbi:hypothetical protein [Halpernia sp.]|uniref:hypothetical protein n=1 Tax=Halpernia sp. TaxID=2782209 RepID=UPI003A910562
MKRKLFNFLSFGIFISVLLSGCRAENETVGFEGNKKQDYVNKSLWNEDEVFIKNVKKIYEKNANEVQMYSKFGSVAWDYATSMNTFNETFLMAPVLKNNQVVAIVTTKRLGNKVFFKFTKQDTEVNDFFKIIIFNDRESISGSDNRKNE